MANGLRVRAKPQQSPVRFVVDRHLEIDQRLSRGDLFVGHRCGGTVGEI
jgi:hypothetical protein